jgi:ubiquinone/menaquinone biosynthesis C-methylase UbiE
MGPKKPSLPRDNKRVLYSAEQYDYYARLFLDEYDAYLIQRVQQEYQAKGGGSQLLVDVGTGTARLLVKIAAVPELRGIQMIGTDFFEDMVAKANQTIREAEHAERIRVLKDDVHAMQFSDALFDLLISRSTIHHWRNPAKAFQEIYRILKPGGVAIIHDIRRDANPSIKSEFQRRRTEAGIILSNFEEKFAPSEIQALVDQADFAQVATIDAPESGFGSLGFELILRKPV